MLEDYLKINKTLKKSYLVKHEIRIRWMNLLNFFK